MLETFLRGCFSIITWLHLTVHPHPWCEPLLHAKGAVLDWWQWRPFEWTHCHIQDDLNSVTWCVILMEAAIRSWAHCDLKEMDVGLKPCSVGSKVHPSHYYTITTSLNCWYNSDPISVLTQQTRHCFTSLCFFCPVLVSLCCSLSLADNVVFQPILTLE